ncbi:bifunctional serine/threonine-protein kinase/formylglycine-generating enzyme family protein [Blastopirellula marina]|uniref:non-specific serine/threonine protein kinase n=1 Tax=Blastopirellula marina DSM 3645 TaxID=314230 RepID=A3ZXL6_9BACT|nr:bifunctional serine/threonine-protein kinase/formylglycine-generating enzyme family protein [Blastopirellula marina]EAQ78811.1 probable serine/threonine protein kinase [Blastopirellula marina DSM 3645]
MTTDKIAIECELDAICDDFESHWQQAERPVISQYATRVDPSLRDTLLVELIRVDVAYRLQTGEDCSIEDYRTLIAHSVPLIDTLSAEFSGLREEASLPERLGRFELLKRVGEGSFGTVWKAIDTRLDRVVAVKLLRNHLAGSAEQAMFAREARSLARLKHPNVVAVHEYGEIDGRPYIVSEFMDGETLRTRISAGPLAPKSAAKFTVDLADALQHFHSKGIVHRDLKPSNILFDQFGEPSIADFGLAKYLDGQTTIAKDGDLIGTLAYMSPEQADGRASEVEPSSDIYALGVILYEMLTGVAPFNGKGKAIIHQILREEPEAPRKRNPAIPVDLDTICLKCMAKEKRDRYPSAAVLLVDLQRYLAGQPILARPISRPVQLWRWVRKNPLFTGAIGFSGVATALAVTMTALAFSQPWAPETGDQRVALSTVPAGATVSFIPLDEQTTEPVPERIIHARQKTPFTQTLPPGNYLVVARLEDENRFHEVYRFVPSKDQQSGASGGPYAHRRWKVLADGRIELPRIKIPTADGITHGMALIVGSDDFLMGSEGSTMVPPHHRSVPSFFIDTQEVTVAEYRKLNASHLDPPSLHYHAVPEDWAICVCWDEAVQRAEQIGKRLPEETEFEYAATDGGRLNHSWESAATAADLEQLFQPRDKFGPVGAPAQDRLLTEPPVYGLCSNMAEWTMTSASAFYPYGDLAAGELQKALPHDLFRHRIVRGGDRTVGKEGNATVNESVRNPRNRYPYPPYFVGRGVSFRCVRSAKPRLLPSDFVRTIDQ